MAVIKAHNLFTPATTGKTEKMRRLPMSNAQITHAARMNRLLKGHYNYRRIPFGYDKVVEDGKPTTFLPNHLGELVGQIMLRLNNGEFESEAEMVDAFRLETGGLIRDANHAREVLTDPIYAGYMYVDGRDKVVRITNLTPVVEKYPFREVQVRLRNQKFGSMEDWV